MIRLKRSLLVLLAVCCLATAVISIALALTPTTPAGGISLGLTAFASGLSEPISLTNADDGSGRLFVLERVGRIKIIEPNGTVRPTPFLDITDRVNSSESNEKGLLGLTFHPSYYENGYFYVNYTYGSGGSRITRISRFSVTADPTIANPNSEDILLTVVQDFANHNAGDIHFGADGYLYIPLGDGGSGGDPNNRAQTPTYLLGKIARIDVDSIGSNDLSNCVGVGGSGNYAIPADNPFVDTNGVCSLIWALGMRNPWRSSFDRLTGALFIGDVGQGSWEEIDYQPASSTGGENYGWRCYEGNHTYNSAGCGPQDQYTFPIFEFVSTTHCSVIGGYVYRGAQYPALYGRYLATDYCSGHFWDLVVDDTEIFTPTAHTNLATFGNVALGEANNCELYLVRMTNGVIYRIQETSGSPQPPGGTALCNHRPITAGESYDVTQGEVLTVAAPGILGNDSDLDGDTLTAVLATPPANGNLSLNADGSFIYTPTVGFAGSDSFTYRAVDAYDESRLTTVTINIAIPNTAPVAINDVYTTTRNATLSVAAPGVLDNDEDGDGDFLTAVLDTAPISGSLNLLASGAFVYTPTANYTGTDSFTYYAFDGLDASDIATVTLHIVEGNAPPVAISDHYLTIVDVPLLVDAPGVLANDSDPNGDPLTAVLHTAPISGSLNLHLDGSFIYTPSLNFIGTDNFTYYANDGQENSPLTATVWLTVTANPLTVTNDLYITRINTPLVVLAPGVLANDTGEMLETAVLETVPSTGTLSFNADGSFIYTPTLGFTGTITFTYRASDGQLFSNPALVTIHVGYPIYIPFLAKQPLAGKP